jgi:hypothetical protein
LAEHYEVTIATVRPGTHPQALAALDETLAGDSDLLACWHSDIGALNHPDHPQIGRPHQSR